MSTLLVNSIVWLYFFMSLLIGLFCVSQFILFLHFYFKKITTAPMQNDRIPFITVQLPIFNEKDVAARVIESTIKLNYPSEKMEIQVLDDSNDETTQIIACLVQKYRLKGFNINHIQRDNREGFKAGALQNGMALTDSNYFCIFDADFVPEVDFLKDALPYFHEENVGVVQTKWGHINQNENLLTKYQSFQLNVHFSIEQGGRYASGNFLQFNGTAGIWRREAIEAGGGWQMDTLTEDLDLSYRSQLQGWKIVYCEQLLSPAELPSEIAGLKSQQFRWMKGGAQTAKKLLPTLWKSPISLSKKIWSSIHLLSSSVYLLIFLIGLLSVPMIIGSDHYQLKTNPLIYLISMLPFIFITSFYANIFMTAPNKVDVKKIAYYFIIFPVSLAMNMGFSLHNAAAVIEGWMGIKSSFVRTPKKGALTKSNYQYKVSRLTYLEGFMALYFLIAVIYAILNQNYSFFIFHLLCFYGYLYVFLLSLKSNFHYKR